MLNNYIGNGKSAVANSIYSIFEGKFQIQSKLGYMGEKSMTSRLIHIPIPKTKIEVVDFFGWDDQEQYESDLRYLIQGLAPDDFTVERQISIFARSDFKPVLEGADKRKFHAVFILVSPAEVAQVNYLAYVQVLYDLINRQGIKPSSFCYFHFGFSNKFALGLQPIILLTKCDQIDCELVDYPEYIYDSDLVDNYITMLEEKKFPRSCIYPVISYYELQDRELNPVKNYLFLSALNTLLRYHIDASLIDDFTQQVTSLHQSQVQNSRGLIEELKKLANDKERSMAAKVNTTQLNITFDDICGLDDVKLKLENVIRTAELKFESNLVKPPKGILLYGPPVCLSKTSSSNLINVHCFRALARR
jgi:hypothetical protein